MNNTATNQAHERIHPFERAGLGLAPFTFVGMHISEGPLKLKDGSTIGAPGQAMGCCKFCYQGIKYCCTIQDVNGERFIVGDTCVNKTHSKGDKVLTDVQRAVKREKSKRLKAKLADRKLVAIELFETHRAAIAALPHSMAHCAKDGLTMAEECQWMIDRAGNRRIVSDINHALKTIGVSAKA